MYMTSPTTPDGIDPTHTTLSSMPTPSVFHFFRHDQHSPPSVHIPCRHHHLSVQTSSVFDFATHEQHLPPPAHTPYESSSILTDSTHVSVALSHASNAILRMGIDQKPRLAKTQLSSVPIVRAVNGHDNVLLAGIHGLLPSMAAVYLYIVLELPEGLESCHIAGGPKHSMSDLYVGQGACLVTDVDPAG